MQIDVQVFFFVSKNESNQKKREKERKQKALQSSTRSYFLTLDHNHRDHSFLLKKKKQLT